MSVLVYSDLHLGTSSAETVNDLVSRAKADDVEAVFVLGDVIDDNREHASSVVDGERYEQQGREFFERLAEIGLPVLVVPGNHDPVRTMDRLVDELETVVSVHEQVVSLSDIGLNTDQCDPLGGGAASSASAVSSST